ncbi:MAG TPA: hypothetical protein VOA88_10965 [Candidatus Dormibacteraeota bacterium]|nr:hypothetical protein [Candidatus Dormibacteraeota bacterium]
MSEIKDIPVETLVPTQSASQTGDGALREPSGQFQDLGGIEVKPNSSQFADLGGIEVKPATAAPPADAAEPTDADVTARD